MNVVKFLEDHHVPHQRLPHRPAYTAQAVAQALHTSGDCVAKTVLLRIGEAHVVAVVPATHVIELPKVKQAIGASSASLAREEECGEHFPDCELGAMPPFGSQYGMRTLVDRALLRADEIVIEGNSHDQAVGIRRDHYMTLEDPQVAEFSHHV